MHISQEQKTVAAMIRVYCQARHGPDGPCEACGELLTYAHTRLAACRFGDGKPTCRQCPTHCYRKDMKTRITEVMRFAGPRMLRHHPILAVRHLLAERRSKQLG